jgi:hypothetical protein
MQALEQMKTVGLEHTLASEQAAGTTEANASAKQGGATIAYELVGGAAVPEQEAEQRTRQAVYAVGEVTIGGSA